MLTVIAVVTTDVNAIMEMGFIVSCHKLSGNPVDPFFSNEHHYFIKLDCIKTIQ